MPTDRLVVRHLEQKLGRGRIRAHVPLASYTTFRIGGAADLFFEARTAAELAEVIGLARQLEVPHFLLGCGANVVIGDRGYRGLVIRNCADQYHSDTATCQLHAASGAIMYPNVIGHTITRGMSGLEHYVGIPSTVGGALWQNLHFLAPAPARERTMFIEEVLLSADILTEENELWTVGVDYFDFSYDHSILHTRDDIVLHATFQLAERDPERMRTIMAENLAWRALRHPPLDTEPSVGSIFKKVRGIGAGRLIDKCQLKGASIGDIVVTHRHANIMVNTGGGRASHLQSLIRYVRDVVYDRTGYALETEITFVGDFESPSTDEVVFLPRPPGLVTAEELARQRLLQT